MKLNELKAKVKAAVKKHWKKGAVAVLAGGSLIFIGYKLGGRGKMLIPKGNFTMTEWPLGDSSDIPIPYGFKSAVIKDLWKEGDDVLMIADDIPIAYLGQFGKELKEKIPELKDMDFAHVAPIGFTKFNLDGEGMQKVTMVFEDSLEKALEAISEMEKAKKK